MRPALALLALLAAPLSPLAQPKPAVETSTYAITGASAGELIRQMRERGPNGFWAWTQAQYNWRYKYARSGGQCRIASAEVDERISMKLPAWTNRDAGKPCLREGFDRMLVKLTEHEQGHVARWSGTKERIRAALLATPPNASCDALGAAANAAGNAEIRNTQAFQDEYDRQTNHGLATGVALREC